MWPSVGQGHAKQSVVHVLGRAVSRPMGAVDVPARRNGHEGGAGAGVHPDSVALSNGRRASTVARYSNQVRPRRSVNSAGPVTAKVSHFGIP
jgi:hypothetical protein